MIGLVRFLYLLAVGLWIGEVLRGLAQNPGCDLAQISQENLAAFSFLVAPAVFRVLDSAAAGDVVGAIFPRYYVLGAVAGATACGLGLVLANASGHPRWWLAAVAVLGVGLAATVWAGTVVQPRARSLRVAMQAAGPESAAAAEFRRLHGRAVALNGAALLAGLVGLGLSAGALRQ